MRARRAGSADRDALLASDELFDGAVRAEWLDDFLSDPRHHLFLVGDPPAGFLSALHYVHPDKPPQMWINELGVLGTHRRKGYATALIEAAAEHAKRLTCREIWVLADPTEEALGFYNSLGWAREGDHIAMFTRQLRDD